MTRIAVLGLGLMGSRMARRLVGKKAPANRTRLRTV